MAAFSRGHSQRYEEVLQSREALLPVDDVIGLDSP